MLIDCDGCAVRHVHCEECVVTVLLDGPDAWSGGVVEVDDGARHALAVLAESGLVPHLRMVPLGPPGTRTRGAAAS